MERNNAVHGKSFFSDSKNQKYKIQGHRIGRQKGEIMLFPLKQSEAIPDDNIDIIDQKLNNLNSRLKNIENILTGFIEAFSNKNDEPKQQRQQQPMQQPPRQQHIPATRFNTFGI